MRSLVSSLGAVVLAAAMSVSVTAHADHQTPATAIGPTDTTQSVSASLILKVRDANALERYVASTQDPFSWNYHQFLSLRQFVDAFAPSDHDIRTITQYLAANGITVTNVFGDNLVVQATGPVDAFNKLFAVQLNDFQDQATGKRFHRPNHHPKIPLLLKDLLVVVQGLDSSSNVAHPHNVSGRTIGARPHKGPALPASGSTATGDPGNYTVGDVANLYNINPLYAKHIDGKGQTIGIVTLANFVPQDAYDYWSDIGLDVKANRITQIHVDGGGPLSSVDGSGETSLDVEQSGGIAPRADLVVYDSPNTDQGFIDLFYKAASDNKADTLSVSWGSPEEFYFPDLNGGEDLTPELNAFHQAFLELTAQGTSIFATAGDSGAYDIFRDPGFNAVLTVDVPGADPLMVCAGGTTVPASMDFGGPSPLVISQEQVWGWDYLAAYYQATFGEDITDEVFSTGGGGGVSTFYALPEFQKHLKGLRVSEPNQNLTYDAGDGTGPQPVMTIAAGVHGRNVPDVALNADPETGYIEVSSTDGGLINFYGGTSFVAPQLNGIAALLNQSTGGRLGQLNPLLYRLHAEYGYSKHSPFVDITAGDNWFYSGIPGYDQGAGLGVLNVANLEKAVLAESFFGF